MIHDRGMILAPEPIKPQDDALHFYIGLGTTGVEVLTRFRKQGIEAEGEFKRRFCFLGIDSGLERSLQDDWGDEAFININPGSLGDLPPHWLFNLPEMAWLEQQQLYLPSSMADHAAGIRVAGRVMLMLRIRPVIDRIRQAILRLHQEMPRTKLQVHVITSMAGGTGSAIFLDVCYLVRQLIQEYGLESQYDLSGYFVMPDAFLGIPGIQRDTIMANGYAALKELDYFMQLERNGGTYKAWYAGRNVEFRKPPVDRCVLISSSRKNGSIRNAPYAYAVSVLVEQLLAEITMLPEFSMPLHLAPIVPKVVPAKNGAFHGYTVVDAAWERLPLEEILNTLACDVYEQFEGLFVESRKQAEKSQEAVAALSMLWFDVIWKSLRDAVSDFTPSGLRAKEVKSAGDNLLIRHYDRQLLQMQETLQKQIRPEVERRIEELQAQLDEWVCDIALGPNFVVAAETDISNLLQKHLAFLKEESVGEKHTLQTLQRNIDQEKQRFNQWHSGRNFKRYEDAIIDYYRAELNLTLNEAVQALLQQLKEGMEKRYALRYLPMAQHTKTLTEQMRECRGRLNLTEEQHNGLLVSLKTLRPMLEEQVQRMKLRPLYAALMHQLLQQPMYQNESDFRKTVERFFVEHVFAGNVSARLLPYLEEKYQTADRNLLERFLLRESLFPLWKTVLEGCHFSKRLWHELDTNTLSVLQVPAQDDLAMRAAIGWKKQIGGSVELRKDGRNGQITMLRYAYGIPLYALADLAVYEAVYERNGRRGHIGFCGPNGDFRNLPSVYPQSLVEKDAPPVVLEAVYHGRSCYDFALRLGLLRMREDQSVIFSRPEEDWQMRVKELMLRIRECIENKDGFAAESLSQEAQQLLNTVPPEQDGICLPDQAGELLPSNVKNNRTCDGFLSSVVCCEIAQEVLGVWEQLCRLDESLQTLAASNRLRFAYYDAVLAEVIRYRGLVVSVALESFGIEEERTLSHPSMPYGRLPLYQGFIGYCELSDEERAQIVERVKERLPSSQHSNRSETLKFWRNRGNWMNLNERIRNYDKKEEMNHFYKEWMDYLHTVMI